MPPSSSTRATGAPASSSGRGDRAVPRHPGAARPGHPGRAPAGCGAGPDEQFGRHRDRPVGPPAFRPVDPVEQQGHALPAHLLEVLPDGGERRSEVPGLRHVVEPDHADVLRNAPARLAQRAHHAERHVVVGREHGRDVRAFGQPSADPVAGLGRPVAEFQRRDGSAGRLQGGVPGGGPAPGRIGVLRSADVQDGTVPQVEEVPGGRGRAGGLVGVHRGEAVLGVAVRDDHGHTGRDVEPRPVEDLRLDDDETVHGLVGQPAHCLLHRVLGLFLRAHHVHRVPGGLRGPRDRGEGTGVAVRTEIEGHHAQRLEPPEREGPRRAVALVAEYPHGGQHAFPGLRLDVGPVVGDPGDGLRGDARERGDIGLRGRPPPVAGSGLRADCCRRVGVLAVVHAAPRSMRARTCYLRVATVAGEEVQAPGGRPRRRPSRSARRCRRPRAQPRS